ERSAAVRARCPMLASVARHVANIRVRNVGTVGGNLAFADPHSDLATLFLALDARVQLASPRRRRELSLDDFVRGPWETARAAAEVGARAAASVDPDDDLYGSADYKREMVAVFTRRALRAAAGRARGVEPVAHYQYAVVA